MYFLKNFKTFFSRLIFPSGKSAGRCGHSAGPTGILDRGKRRGDTAEKGRRICLHHQKGRRRQHQPQQQQGLGFSLCRPLTDLFHVLRTLRHNTKNFSARLLPLQSHNHLKPLPHDAGSHSLPVRGRDDPVRPDGQPAANAESTLLNKPRRHGSNTFQIFSIFQKQISNPSSMVEFLLFQSID